MFDVHCHLEYMDNPKEVIKKAKEKGMSGFATAVSDLKDKDKIMKIAKENKGFVYPCFGLHPERLQKYDMDKINDYISYIKKQKNNIAAIGEIGLDYNWIKDKNKREYSKKIFKKFIKLSKKLNKPMVLHIRDAFSDALDILKDEKLTNNADNVIIHFFSGNKKDLKECLKRGYWVSFNTIICKSKYFYKLVKKTPMERMLLETDAPWIDPDNDSSELTNRPWKIDRSAKKIAELKDKTKKEILNITDKNAHRALRI